MRRLSIAALFLLLVAAFFAEGALSAEISGRVTVCASKPLTAVESAQILIGKDLLITNQKDISDTIVNPENIVGEARTDKNGWFFLNVPAGNYTLIIWKEFFVPVCMKVTVTGKDSFPCSLVRDQSSGWKERHVKLTWKKPGQP